MNLIGEIQKIGCVNCGKDFLNITSVDMFCSDECEKEWTAVRKTFPAAKKINEPNLCECSESEFYRWYGVKLCYKCGGNPHNEGVKL